MSITVERIKAGAPAVKDMLLGEYGLELSLGQVLHILAAVFGCRNWAEVMAKPDRVFDGNPFDATARVNKRVHNLHRIRIVHDDIMVTLIEGYPLVPNRPRIGVDDEDSRAGVFVCLDEKSVHGAIAEFVALSNRAFIGGAPFYTTGIGLDHPDALELTDRTLLTKDLRNITGDSLFIISDVDLTGVPSQHTIDRVVAAFKVAGNVQCVVLHCKADSLAAAQAAVSAIIDGRVLDINIPACWPCSLTEAGALRRDGDWPGAAEAFRRHMLAVADRMNIKASGASA